MTTTKPLASTEAQVWPNRPDPGTLVYGSIDPRILATRCGIDILRDILEGRLPNPTMQRTLDFGLSAVAAGEVTVSGRPSGEMYNPIGSVHAGFAATLLDSAMACAVWSVLEAGLGFMTMEFKISLVRPITAKTGEVDAIGKLISRGKRAATAEGRLIDRAGKLLAHGTSTCLIVTPGT